MKTERSVRNLIYYTVHLMLLLCSRPKSGRAVYVIKQKGKRCIKYYGWDPGREKLLERYRPRIQRQD
jgi:hypothetical protein